jgi:hypothetical protein
MSSQSLMPTRAYTLLLLVLLIPSTLQAQASASCSPDLAQQVQELKAQVALLAQQMAELRGERSAIPPVASSALAPTPAAPPTPAPPTQVAAAPPQTASPQSESPDPWHGTTLNATLDGYYAYNFTKPYTGTNQLRAYDLSANSFSINQATVILEHAPNPRPGDPSSRFGVRLDLQFGQATETLQGSSANELQPQVWRNLYQAYGSYVAPVGSGLHLDFGKFASSLGNAGNYTKDQINYSRAFFYNALPFYHTGLRASYDLTPRLNVAYWLVNGTQQTDDFNGFKSQAFLFTLKPAKTVSWTVNYYFGQEARSTTLAGTPITPTPNGREHIFDTYATWTPNARWTVVAEADLVLNRTYAESAPQHYAGGLLTLRYRLPHQYALAARSEYLADPQGLFSGSSQALKEATGTFERRIGDNFLLRAEYRRDLSNQRFFLTQNPLIFSHAQSTATLGLVWWYGAKQGSW